MLLWVRVMKVSDQAPWSPDAEREILGSILIDPACLDRLEDLDADDVYHQGHRQILLACRTVWSREGTLDQPLILDQLQTLGMDRQQAHGWIAGLLDHVGTSANVERYARIVSERAVLRRLADTCSDIAHEACSVPEEVEAFASSSADRVRTVAESGAAADLVGMERACELTMARIMAAKEGDERVLGLTTGWSTLDGWTGGLPRGVTVVAARPKHGKSAWIAQLVAEVASRGWGVFVWSGEMQVDEITARMAGQKAKLCISELAERTELQPYEWDQLQDAMNHCSQLPVYIDCQPGLTAGQICARARRAQRLIEARGYQLRLVVVDHFHLIRHPREGAGRTDEAMAVSSGLFRDWSKELGVSLVMAAQLRRPAAGMDQRPKSHHVRECGAIEQDCQLMLGLALPYKWDPQADKGCAEVWVLEQRLGPEGLIPCHFDGPTMRWKEVLI